MRNILAELWHPLEGVSITEIEEKRIMFRFYNEIDLKRVMDEIPSFFNMHLIIFHRLTRGEDPVQIPLFHANFWVQIHSLLLGFMSEGMARYFRNFIREFIEYVAALVTRGVRKFMLEKLHFMGTLSHIFNR
ncbi:hypothetical protein PVK06_019600 [Gossypium arboreum]|uniref:DUF4283 domain-containing protein n=1 Tax=Gossypium arboreum TaxID=29729 RepID=A0ABR0PKK0_GOSAR|nr:hypothetical protein PVK06_019600 [Gossypium arboreum]